MKEHIVVVGGGLVGASIAYGAARSGLKVTVLDQGDAAFRASRGNFGLVWLSSKGGGMTRYASWTRDAVRQWPTLHNELLNLTGVNTGLEQTGGFWLGFSEKEIQQRAQLLEKINRAVSDIPYQMMDHSELKQYLPGLGPKVIGGSYGAHDGHANPLMLLRALHAGLKLHGADIVSGVDIISVSHNRKNGKFTATSRDGQTWTSDRLLLAAGIGITSLAEQVGLFAPTRPTRGQVLITERLKPFIPYPTNKARQTIEGSVQIGSTSEDVGLNDRTTPDKISGLAERAVDTFPALKNVRLVRAWGAIRPLTPDGYPVYQASTECPGAFAVICHSGVTLAAIHAYVIAPWVAGLTPQPPEFEGFHSDRFLDPNASFTNDH